VGSIFVFPSRSDGDEYFFCDRWVGEALKRHGAETMLSEQTLYRGERLVEEA